MSSRLVAVIQVKIILGPILLRSFHKKSKTNKKKRSTNKVKARTVPKVGLKTIEE